MDKKEIGMLGGKTSSEAKFKGKSKEWISGYMSAVGARSKDALRPGLVVQQDGKDICRGCGRELDQPRFLIALHVLMQRTNSEIPDTKSRAQMAVELNMTPGGANGQLMDAYKAGFVSMPFGTKIGIFKITPDGKKFLASWIARGYKPDEAIKKGQVRHAKKLDKSL